MNKRPSNTQNKNENPSSLLRDLWLGSCARYTVLCMLLLPVSFLVSLASESVNAAYIDPLRFLLLLPFAFCLTLAARTRRAGSLSTAAKCTLHPILVLGGFYVFGYLPFQIASKPSGQQILLILLLAALVYGLFMGVVCLISRSARRKQVEDTPYVSQYARRDGRK